MIRVLLLNVGWKPLCEEKKMRMEKKTFWYELIGLKYYLALAHFICDTKIKY